MPTCPLLPPHALPAPAARRSVLAAAWAVLATLAGPAAAQAQATADAGLLTADLNAQITALARTGAASTDQPALRVEVEVGALDPRLQLAPCQRIQPYLPAGVPPWGRTRVGIKCVQGSKAWNVTLPVTVHVWRPGVLLREAVAAGTPLRADQLMTAEIDQAASPAAPLSSPSEAVGRVLARPLAAGSPLHGADFRARQWFAAGETVKVVAGGAGWRIATEGQALSPGIEGQLIRVRIENGKLLVGRAVADRLVEISL